MKILPIVCALAALSVLPAHADIGAVRKTAGSPKEIAAAWTKLAEQGDADAGLARAYCNLIGFGVPYDPEAARQWMLKAWKAGNAHAGFLAATAMLPSGDGTVFRHPFDNPEIVTAFVKQKSAQTNRTPPDNPVIRTVQEKAATAGNPDARATSLSLEYEKKPASERPYFMAAQKSRISSGDLAALYFVTKKEGYFAAKPGTATVAEQTAAVKNLRRCLTGGLHEAAWELAVILRSHPELAASSDERDDLLESQRHQPFVVAQAVHEMMTDRANPNRIAAWLTPLAEQDDTWALQSLIVTLRANPDIMDAEKRASDYEARLLVVLKTLSSAGDSEAKETLKRMTK